MSSWWRGAWVPGEIQQLIYDGVSPDLDVLHPKLRQLPKNISHINNFHCCRTASDLQFCIRELEDLVARGMLVRCYHPKHFNKFFAARNSKLERRLVIHPKWINEASSSPTHVQYMDLRSVQSLLQPGMLIWLLDLKQAYYQIRVAPWFSPYLCVRFNGKTFMCKVLFLGLNFAPLVFTLITSPVWKTLRSWGITVSAYLDDFFGGVPFQPLGVCHIDAATHALKLMFQLFETAGLVISMTKSNTVPSLCTRVLGLMVNSEDMTLSIPVDKQTDLISFARCLAAKKSVQTRSLARFLGKLNAVRMAFDPPKTRVGNLFPLLYSIADPWSQDARVQLNHRAQVDLKKIAADLAVFHKKKINTTTQPLLLVFTDASYEGFGVWIPASKKAIQGHFTAEELRLATPVNRRFDPQILEMLAVIRAADHLPSNCPWALMTDNISTRHYVTKRRGASLTMTSLSVILWNRLQEIKSPLISGFFIPGRLNLVSDYLSRCFPHSFPWTLQLWENTLRHFPSLRPGFIVETSESPLSQYSSSSLPPEIPIIHFKPGVR